MTLRRNKGGAALVARNRSKRGVHLHRLDWGGMRRDVIARVGTAAVIILAPGGFVLGLALLARRYRRQPESAPPGVPGEQQPAGDHQQPA